MVSSPSDGGFVRAALHGYKRYAVVHALLRSGTLSTEDRVSIDNRWT